MLGAAMLVIVVATGGGTAGYLLGRQRATPTPKPSAAPTLGATPAAESRARDTRPLRLSEVFGRQTLVQNGNTYRMTINREEPDCITAIKGDQLQSALRQQNCSQLLRASFESNDGKVIGSFGVANLPDAQAARAVYNTIDGPKGQYMLPLPTSTGNTAQLRDQASAYIYWKIYGHYVVIGFVQFVDGHKASDTEKQQYFDPFAWDVQDGIVTPLAYRAITGKTTG